MGQCRRHIYSGASPRTRIGEILKSISCEFSFLFLFLCLERETNNNLEWVMFLNNHKDLWSGTLWFVGGNNSIAVVNDTLQFDVSFTLAEISSEVCSVKVLTRGSFLLLNSTTTMKCLHKLSPNFIVVTWTNSRTTFPSAGFNYKE